MNRLNIRSRALRTLALEMRLNGPALDSPAILYGLGESGVCKAAAACEGCGGGQTVEDCWDCWVENGYYGRQGACWRGLGAVIMAV